MDVTFLRSNGFPYEGKALKVRTNTKRCSLRYQTAPFGFMELRLGGLEDGGEEVVAAVAFFGGEGDEADGVRQLQDLTDAGQVGRDLALF